MNQIEYTEMFDRGAERKGTDCIKWDRLESLFGSRDLIPLWIADMDFPSPGEVREALIGRAAQGVYGYTDDEDQAVSAACGWMKKRHGLEIKEDQVLLSPGVVDSLAFAVNAYTKENDTVVIQPPVYGPFERVVRQAGRGIRFNPLKCTQDGWRMDMDDLEQAFREGAKLLLLCSPHNPVGRVWTPDELRAVSRLCMKYGVKLVADEIHGDFEMPGFTHTPILSVDPTAVSLISATKTFNLAGLRISSMLFGQQRDRQIMQDLLNRLGMGEINMFATLAQKTAYEAGEPWLNALVAYLKETNDAVDRAFLSSLPGIRITRQEGTYLKWLDMRYLHMKQEKLEHFIADECGVALSGGMSFTVWGSGFMRMNIASPRELVLRATEQIIAKLH